MFCVLTTVNQLLLHSVYIYACMYMCVYVYVYVCVCVCVSDP